MATRFDKFTVKAQEALQGTQDVAGRFARGGWRSEERADDLRAGHSVRGEAVIWKHNPTASLGVTVVHELDPKEFKARMIDRHRPAFDLWRRCHEMLEDAAGGAYIALSAMYANR